MQNVGNKLPVNKWKHLADHLGLDTSVTDEIEGTEKGNPRNCIRQVFIFWEKSLSESHPYSWATVIHTLEQIGEIHLATSIMQFH